MFMYARRHGHGYKVVIPPSKVSFGSGRPDRHPVWAKVALMHNVINNNDGADFLRDKRCSEEEHWVQLMDTDIVVASTGDHAFLYISRPNALHSLRYSLDYNFQHSHTCQLLPNSMHKNKDFLLVKYLKRIGLAIDTIQSYHVKVSNLGFSPHPRLSVRQEQHQEFVTLALLSI
jgi:hypothetical protein